MSLKEDALEYHRFPTPGKIEVVATKPCQTQRDLSLAYSPGVAEPCLAIAADPELAFQYTSKGNLVAVITDGTAVLGLGNIGPLAGKPVMEGKGVLFKRFAGIDVFDIELDVKDDEAFIAAVAAMAPTFGGINLEDIAAPRCFEIERRLEEMLDIPVFHDDQHGTAIIASAGLLNALEIQKKEAQDVRVVIGGAGAAAVAIAGLIQLIGVRQENILMTDSRGVIHSARTDLNTYKERFAVATEARTLADALIGADVFLGCSVANTMTQEMVRSMAERPIIFAMANPDPEIPYEDALAARDDVIMATGRSDYPNQVNNVLGFPFIFRGALDVRSRSINNEMKLNAVKALAELAREPVPTRVLEAYDLKSLEFGRDYIIPKPLDPRVLLRVTPAVAKGAVDSGVARHIITDWDAYRDQLEMRLGPAYSVILPLRNVASRSRKRIAFPEGSHPKVIQAATRLVAEKICKPVLIGHRDTIVARAQESGQSLEGIEIHDPDFAGLREELAERYLEMRARKGATPRGALLAMENWHQYAAMLLRQSHVDGVVAGINLSYAEVIRPALQILGRRPGNGAVSGVYVLAFRSRVLFFGDCTVNVDPSAEELVAITHNTVEIARHFGVVPRVAMLSFGNFGSSNDPECVKMKRATQMLKDQQPDFNVDGEMQANAAFEPALREEYFPYCELEGEPNVLIFPNLSSANIAYKLLGAVGGAQLIGPILVGLGRPMTVLQMGVDVPNIVTMAVITASQAVAFQRETT